jgi:hypothetical protein
MIDRVVRGGIAVAFSILTASALAQQAAAPVAAAGPVP